MMMKHVYFLQDFLAFILMMVIFFSQKKDQVRRQRRMRRATKRTAGKNAIRLPVPAMTTASTTTTKTGGANATTTTTVTTMTSTTPTTTRTMPTNVSAYRFVGRGRRRVTMKLTTVARRGRCDGRRPRKWPSTAMSS